ncbi:MAG: FliA/WhiG family RNA polymerase sigma factor [bacterium]
MNTQALWATFAAGGEAARDALLTEHLSLVHHVARQLSRSLASNADIDELVSAGTMGLMSSVEAFDASRGLAFSTFAVPRIRGAILDELRRQDHVPRSVRRKTREIAHVRESLMRQLGRQPEAKEVAEALNVDLDTLWRWQSEMESAVHIPLDRTASDRESTSPSPAELLSGEDEGADEAVGKQQELALMREAIQGLKDQERTVLSLYYFEELKLHEIAEILSLTESRVSQIRSKALTRLRTKLAPMRAAN